MIHAYDKNYLTAAQKCLARMLDYMVNDLQYPLETVWNWFLMSEISHHLNSVIALFWQALPVWNLPAGYWNRRGSQNRPQGILCV